MREEALETIYFIFNRNVMMNADWNSSSFAQDTVSGEVTTP